MGCDGVLRFFLRCTSFGCISVVCGAGHFERVFGAFGWGHTMGFEGKCRSREFFLGSSSSELRIFVFCVFFAVSEWLERVIYTWR